MSAHPNRRLRLPVAGLALAALALPAGADARVPGIGNGLRVDTVGPDLVSVTIIDADLTGNAPEIARYCFDRPIDSVAGNGDGFRIRSYDSRRWWDAFSAARNRNGDIRCVDANFPANFDISQGTIGEITKATAVTASDASQTVPASEPLQGSAVAPALGTSSAPDLVGADISGNQVRFRFDEVVDPADATLIPSRFKLEDQNVGYTSATSVVASGKTVTASYPSTYDITKARGAWVEAGATRDRIGSAGPTLFTPNQPRYALLATGAAGGMYPESASWAGPNVLELNYRVTGSNTLSTVYQNQFSLLRDDGEIELPSVDPIIINGRTVRLTFPAYVGEQPEAWVALSASPEAARLAGGSTQSYTAGGTIGLGTAPSLPGRTSGPDLLAATYDEFKQIVTYAFDEGVKTTGPAAGYFALQSDRRLNAVAPGVVQGLASNIVRTNQEPTLSAANAVGVGVSGLTGEIAATDVNGDPSPSSSIAFAVEQAPATPAPAPAPAPVIVPPTPVRVGGSTTLLRKILKKTKKTKTKKAQPYAVKYSGRLSSSSQGCIARRSIVFVAKRKNGDIKTLGTAISNANGAYALSLKSRPKGKVTVTVAERAGDNCGLISGGGINA